MTDLLLAALATVKTGVPVFQLAPRSKVPTRGSSGFKDATRDVGIVNALWNETPDGNIGVPMGRASGRVVLDVDPRHGGAETLPQLLGDHELPETQRILTMGHDGGWQYVFVVPDGMHVPTKLLGPGLELRGEGAYTLWPPSVHPDTGQTRRFADETPPAPFPEFLSTLGAGSLNGRAPRVNDVIPSGQRNDTLASLAGTMRRRGLGEPAIHAALTVTNKTQCQPPLPDDEVRAIAESISRYEPGTPLGKPAYTGPARQLAETRAIFEQHLYLPDPGGLYVVLATVAANLLEGDPLWLLLIAASGGGKTELLNALLGLPGVHAAATLTEAALLSGTSKRETASDARGGLLREVGEQGMLIHKDFGSVLSMNRDARALVLAALREIYDGAWTRRVGTDGGRMLTWSGKLGLVAGATPVIDQHHAVMAALGERFLLYRVDVGDTRRQAEQSLANSSNIRRVRAELREAVSGLFAGLDLTAPTAGYTRGDVTRLVALSTLIVRCRSAVIRDSYTREVELVPDSEAPGRLVSVLGRLLTALRAIGVDEAEAWRVTLKAALDSMPALRRQALELLLDHAERVTTTAVAAAVGLPTQTARRVLQDLTAHGVTSRIPAPEKGKADTWQATAWTRQQHQTASVPETSE